MSLAVRAWKRQVGSGGTSRSGWRNQGFVLLTGVSELDAMLRVVGPKIGNRAARTVLSKAVRLGVKKIKARVPSSHKSVRKSIGGHVKRQRGSKIITAKFGAAVGKKMNANSTARKGGGVGISPNNVHWYILGTGERTVTATGQRVGKMPAHPIVKEAMAAGGGEIVAMMKREMRPALEREFERASRRLLKKRSR